MRLKHPQVFLLIWGFLEGGGAGCVHPRTGTGSARRDRLENSLFCVITSGPCPPFHFLWNPPPSRSSELKEKKKIQNNKNEGPHLFQAAPLPAPTAVQGGRPVAPPPPPETRSPPGGQKKQLRLGKAGANVLLRRSPKAGGWRGRGGTGSRGEAGSPEQFSPRTAPHRCLGWPGGEAITGWSGQPTGSGGVLEPSAGRGRLHPAAAGNREPRGGGGGAPLRGPAAGGRVSLAPQPRGGGAALL